MDLLICIILVGTFVSLQISKVAVLLLGAITLVLAVGRVRQGRWQIAPVAVAAGLMIVAQLFLASGDIPTWLFSIFAILTLLAVLIIYWSPLPHTLRPGGPYQVGLRRIDVPADGERERLQVHLWYPADPGASRPPRRVFDAAEANGFASSLRAVGAPAFLNNHFRLARSHSFADALPVSGEFPLVVFNHGGAMWPTHCQSLMEELASGGYIVASVSHPGETSGVVWADGDMTPISDDTIGILKGTDSDITVLADYMLCQDREEKRALLARLRDIQVDRLTAATTRWARHSIGIVEWLLGDELPGSAREVAANLAGDKVVYVGMSLGGSVAHECCYLDSRAIAAVNLDGMNWTFDRIDKEMPVPVLNFYGDPRISAKAMSSKADIDAEVPDRLSSDAVLGNDFFYESRETAGTRDDIFRVIVPGAGHMAFTDQALASRGPMRALSGSGQISGRKGLATINTLCREFLDDAIAGDGFDATEACLSDSGFVRQKLGAQPR